MKPVSNRRLHRGAPISDYGTPRTPNHSKPSGAWRKKFDCKKNKGPHTFELVKPKNMRKDLSTLDVDGYYAAREKQREQCLAESKATGKRLACIVLYYYRCTACGKESMKMNEKDGKFW